MYIYIYIYKLRVIGLNIQENIFMEINYHCDCISSFFALDSYYMQI